MVFSRTACFLGLSKLIDLSTLKFRDRDDVHEAIGRMLGLAISGLVALTQAFELSFLSPSIRVLGGVGGVRCEEPERPTSEGLLQDTIRPPEESPRLGLP